MKKMKVDLAVIGGGRFRGQTAGRREGHYH